MKLRWWGYLHIDGSIHAKQVIWSFPDDFADAWRSPFVKRTFDAFEAASREDAVNIISQKLKGETE